jgi:hypothetical protein
MANVIYNAFKVNVANGGIDLDTDTIKVMLVTSSYTPDQDNHDYVDDITNEVSGTGYTAGGATLASKTVTQDNTNNRMVFDAANVTWSTATITARGAVVYKDTGTASTSPLIAYYDFSVDKASSGGDFVVEWNAVGLLTLS